MKLKIISILFVISFGFTGGLVVGTITATHQQIKPSDTWSEWSSPAVLHPSSPFPQWVLQQYRTNLITGEIKVKVISHGSAASMFEKETVTVD